MKIVVFGTGGVGGYFGGRLAQQGQDVTFLARGAQLQAILQKGLTVQSVNGDFEISPAKASANPEEVGVADVVLVAVKAWQVEEAAAAMRPLVGAHTLVIPLQNGIGAPATLRQHLGAEAVLGGLCRISAFVEAPGVIKHVGVQPFVAFGRKDGKITPAMQNFLAVLQACPSIRAEIPADIEAAMWLKFMFIAAISGLGAVTRQPIGVYRALPESRALLIAALQEADAVARALGVALPALAVANTLAFIDAADPNMLASMQRDHAEGRPSELEAQNGTVVRLGAEVGIPTPAHSFLYAALLPGERLARAA